MAVTRTFSIIKPDATRRNLTGAVTKMLEDAGLRVVASKRIHMTREQAEGFYAVHKERPFFGELVEFMMSEPVVVQVLEGEDAVTRNRDIMGATNPADAPRARSARNWRSRSARTPSTVRTAKKTPRSKSPSSSSRKKSWAKSKDSATSTGPSRKGRPFCYPASANRASCSAWSWWWPSSLAAMTLRIAARASGVTARPRSA